jgi:hypothetical protein
MFDDTNISEAIQPTPTTSDIIQDQVPVEQATQPAQPTDDQARNFKQLREKADRVSRERDEALSRLREYESRINQATPSKPQNQESDDFTMAPDELAEGKHISKVQNQLNKLRQEVRVATAEAKLKAQYPDFDSVVTKENVQALRDTYPEIAFTLNSSSDIYATGSSAYTLIKKLGIIPEDNYHEKQIVHANAAKPKPLASVSPQQGDSPLSRANAFANGLTPELKSQMIREMREARRNL